MKLLEGTPQEVLDDVYHNVITLTPGAETFCRILKQVRTSALRTHSARTLHALCTRSALDHSHSHVQLSRATHMYWYAEI